MRIDIEQSIATGPTSFRLSHGGQSMIWDASTYNKASDRSTPMDTERIFRELNGFWASLTEEEQGEYWNLYVAGRQVLDNIFDNRDIVRDLQAIVAEMYKLPSLDKLHHWVVYRSGLKIPADMKDTFEEVNADMVAFPHQKEKTYTRPEYIDLAVLTVSLRLMVPFWGEFVKIARRSTGGTTKELEGYRLLYYSKLHNSPAMKRLQVYVSRTVNDLQVKEDTSAAIMNGMGTDEVADWLLAMTIVRRLSMCAINAADDRSTIVTNVYQYVKMNLGNSNKKHGKKFGGRITLRQPKDVGDENNKKSSAEVYRVRQDIPDGIRVALQVQMDDPDLLLLRALGLSKKGERIDQVRAKYQDSNEMRRFRLCLDHILRTPDFEISPHHITLTQWTLSRVFPPKGVVLLTMLGLQYAMAVAQVVLWEQGHLQLAALLSAMPLMEDEEGMVGAMESRGRIPKETMEDLTRLWPYAQPVRGKQSARQSNVAAKAIDAVCEQMVMSDWMLYCPNELLESIPVQYVGRRFIIPSDIRWLLAQLLIYIHSAQKVNT